MPVDNSKEYEVEIESRENARRLGEFNDYQTAQNAEFFYKEGAPEDRESSTGRPRWGQTRTPAEPDVITEILGAGVIGGIEAIQRDVVRFLPEERAAAGEYGDYVASLTGESQIPKARTKAGSFTRLATRYVAPMMLGVGPIKSLMSAAGVSKGVATWAAPEASAALVTFMASEHENASNLLAELGAPEWMTVLALEEDDTKWEAAAKNAGESLAMGATGVGLGMVGKQFFKASMRLSKAYRRHKLLTAELQASGDKNLAEQIVNTQLELEDIQKVGSEDEIAEATAKLTKLLKSRESRGDMIKRWQDASDEVLEGMTAVQKARVANAVGDVNAPPLRVGEDGEVYFNFARIARGNDEDYRNLVQSFYDQHADEIHKAARGVRSHQTSNDAANRLLRDPDWELRGRLNIPDTEQTLAMRKLLNSMMDDFERKSIKAAATGSVEDLYAQRVAHLAALRVGLPTLAARTEQARALNSWAKKVGSAGGDPVHRFKAMQAVVEETGGEEIGIAFAKRIADMKASGVSTTAILNASKKGKWVNGISAVREVMMSGMVSGPTTHLVNVGSNTAALVQGPLSVMSAEGAGNIAEGEGAAMLIGLIRSTGDAFGSFYHRLRHDTTKLPFGSLQKVEIQDYAISSRTMGGGRMTDFLGNAVRAPGMRLLGAEDDFFKMYNYRAKLHGLAYRNTINSGAKPGSKDFWKKVNQLADDPTTSMMSEASDYASYQTFTDPLQEHGMAGRMAQGMSKLRAKAMAGGEGAIPAALTEFGMRMVFPYVRTPSRIFGYTFEHLPGLNLTQRNFWQNMAAGGGRAEAALGQVATGGGLMLMAYGMAAEGMITGSGPLDPNRRSTLMSAGWRPAAWRSADGGMRELRRLDQYALPLQFAADTQRVFSEYDMSDDQSAEFSEIMAASVASMAAAVNDRSYLTGLTHVMALIEGASKGRDMSKLAGQFAGQKAMSVMPWSGLIRSINNEFAPEGAPLQEVFESGETAGETISMTAANTVIRDFEYIIAALADLESRLPHKIDIWGDAILRSYDLESLLGANTPYKRVPSKDSPANEELQRLVKSVDNYIPRMSMTQTFTDYSSGESVPVDMGLFPHLFERLQTIAGKEAWLPTTDGVMLNVRDYADGLVSGDPRIPMSDYYQTATDEARLGMLRSLWVGGGDRSSVKTGIWEYARKRLYMSDEAVELREYVRSQGIEQATPQLQSDVNYMSELRKESERAAQ